MMPFWGAVSLAVSIYFQMRREGVLHRVAYWWSTTSSVVDARSTYQADLSPPRMIGHGHLHIAAHD